MKGSAQILAIVAMLLVSCQARERRAVTVQGSAGSLQPGTASPGGGVLQPGNSEQVLDPNAPANQQGAVVPGANGTAEGKAYVGAWNGMEDEPDSAGKWTVKNVSGSTNPSSTVTTPGAGTGTAASVSYDGQIKALLDRACVRCHAPTGSRPLSPMQDYASAKAQGAASKTHIEAGSMPPGAPLGDADKKLFADWAAAGYPQSATGSSTGSLETSDASADPNIVIIEISDERYGNYLNQTEVTAKVGQTLRIVNKRASAPFTIHTNGAPFPHATSAIAAGSQQDYKLLSPYNNDGGVYEHTDGSVNRDRLINLRVSQ